MAHRKRRFGLTDADNAELRIVGEVRKIENRKTTSPSAKCMIGSISSARPKVSGAKFYYLKNDLVLLEQALVRFALER